MPVVANATFIVEGEVVEVLLNLGLAHMRGSNGLVYGLRPHTPGICDWGALKEGQRFRCQVTAQLHRVLRADVLT